MKLEALVTSSGAPPLSSLSGTYTVGVPHDGNSCRAVFHTVRPVARSAASTNDSFCVSHCTITMFL